LLFSEDKALINEFVMEVQYLEKVNQKQEMRAQELMDQARKLIEDIQKLYHLK
jgi:TolA-binding protein